MSRQDVESTPGEMLAEAREALGLSLNEAAAMTRISATMLSHLEAERYDEYTAEVFVRGHLKSYARELKLDPQRVVQAYNRQVGRGGASDHSASGAGEAKASGGADDGDFESPVSGWRRQVRPAHLVAVGLVLVFLFVVVHLVTGSRATAKDPDRFESQSEEERWEVEEAVEETRWALERPSGDDDSSADEDKSERD